MNKKIIPTVITLLLLFVSIPLHVHAQQAADVTGTWHGVLNVQGTQLRLVFHIEQSDNRFSATFDSPDQGVAGIPFSSATFEDSVLVLEAQNIGAAYRAVFSTDSLAGTWNQGGMNFLLNMYREVVEPTAMHRPQEPVRPYPYLEEEVSIHNQVDGITLAGTLTLPEAGGSFPVLILISGSGPQNRNQEIFGHKPFLVLADQLTREGFAVLRYDDRGFGASTGTFGTATTEDFAVDVLSAIDFLKDRPEIDADRIGLIGHSEGGIIAPMVSNRSDDVAHIILLAGTGIPGKEVLFIQATSTREMELPNEEAYMQLVRGALDIASSDKELHILRDELAGYLRQNETLIRSFLPAEMDMETYIQQDVAQSLSPWVRYFYNYNPAEQLETVDVPVLALFGSNDRQVTPAENLPAVEAALQRSGTNTYLVKELPGLNHMFQQSETGYVSEYNQIEQTISPLVIEEIITWINSLP
ncbi:MAG: alpha/beta fold hydrolase [Balneolaceae bacterium]